MRRLNVWSILMLMAMALPLTIACGGDSDDGNTGGGGGSGSGGGWFANKIVTSMSVSYEGEGYYKDYVLEHIDEFFLSDGRYGGSITLPDGMTSHGPAYCNDDIDVIHIVNDNSLEYYEHCYLYKYNASGTKGKTLLYRVTGSSLGDVAFYASTPRYFNCSRTGNVITVFSGEFKGTISVTGDGILLDGGEKWSKFNLGQTYTARDNGSSDSSSDIADARTVSKNATLVGSPTFHTATFRCEFGTSSKGKQDYKKVFAFSKNKADLENPDQLASRYHKLGGVMSVHYPPTYGKRLDVIYANGSGYLEDGDLRFADEQTGDLSNFTVAYDELNVTVYYCPVLMVTNTAVSGEIKSVSMRQLKQTSGFVDLGLSCLWQATNNNASSPWNFGYSITLLDKNVSGGGRLPTKDEVLELNKCRLECVDNGVLVTGLNGNEIFIPFRDTQGNTTSPGYGTSSTQTSGSYKYDVLYTFDSSTNKFTTHKASNAYNYGQYTMHESAYVRPVKDGGGSGDSGGGNSDGGGSSSSRHYLYGENSAVQPPFQVSSWDAASLRFSNTYGMYLPTIPDNVYYGLKTLIFDVSDASADCDLRVMNGWWSNIYYDHIPFVSGLNEIKITETMAKECAMGGEGKDLNLMLYNGTCTIKAVYYDD